MGWEEEEIWMTIGRHTRSASLLEKFCFISSFEKLGNTINSDFLCAIHGPYALAVAMPDSDWLYRVNELV
jgi:hypothetical protein